MRILTMHTVFALLIFALAVHADAATTATAVVSPGALLRADQFDRLDDYYNSFLMNYDPRKTNSYLPLGYALSQPSYTTELFPHLDKWVAARPRSYFARLIRGSMDIELAWAVHGANLFANIGPEARRVFEDSLAKADADLNEAVKINPSIPFAQARLIAIDQMLDRGLETATAHFLAARKADPSYTPAYTAYLWLLSPRHGGDVSMMKTFVANNADRIPGSNLPFLWGVYHSEMAAPGNEGSSWWNDPANWKQVEDGFNNAIALQPNPIGARCMLVLYAQGAGKTDFMRKQLELIGPYWGEYLPESMQTAVFDCVKTAWPKADPEQWMIGKATAELAKHPRAARPLMLRGIASCREKKYTEAIADLTRAIELDPDLVHGWMELAISYDATHQTANALNAAEHYLMVRPSAERIVQIKGNAIRASGKLDDSIKFFREKLELFPTLAGVYDSLATALREKRDWPALIETCTEGLPWAQRQQNETVLFDLYWLRGLAHQQQAELPQAFDSFAEALKYDPGDRTLDKFAELYRAGGQWARFKNRIPRLVEQNYHAGGDESKRNAALERFHEKL
ncbi:hypothetical protein LLG95_02845 [bacterium]|nr:hypothetical protein [bacterium]